MKKTAGLCLIQDTRIITRYLSYYLFLTIMSIFVQISSKCPFSVSGGEVYVFDLLNALPSFYNSIFFNGVFLKGPPFYGEMIRVECFRNIIINQAALCCHARQVEPRSCRN